MNNYDSIKYIYLCGSALNVFNGLTLVGWICEDVFCVSMMTKASGALAIGSTFGLMFALISAYSLGFLG